MNTIDTIVRELEQIPEPMKQSVLEFIRSLCRSNIATNKIEETERNNNPAPGVKRRTTSSLIAGKGRTVGDIVSPIVNKEAQAIANSRG
jgi:hypothetical protein